MNDDDSDPLAGDEGGIWDYILMIPMFGAIFIIIIFFLMIRFFIEIYNYAEKIITDHSIR